MPGLPDRNSREPEGMNRKLKIRSFQDDGRDTTKAELRARGKVPGVSVSASSAGN